MTGSMTKDLETFPGARYWRAMQGSVDAILTPLGIRRKVFSMGTQFLNYDAWTGEAFAHGLCDFLAKHPDRMPERAELLAILRRANASRCKDPHIRVARMPDRVNLRVARAIVGGGYHEAYHTKYSKRDVVRYSEVQPILEIGEQVTLAGGEFDAKMRVLLMTLHHLVEDIRIERRGNEDFEGAVQAMRDLQDFILDLEFAARKNSAKVKNVTVSMNARSIMLCAFRDLGLGYNTQKARQTLQFYKEHAPGALALMAPGGILAPMLYEAKNLGRDDQMGSLRVAMKIVVELWRITQQASPQDDNGLECPRCGAGPKDLVIRSVKNEQGVKIKGRAELECKMCGHKHEFDLPDNSLNLNQQNEEQEDSEEKPEIEDLDQEDIGEGGDGFGDDARERARDHQAQQNEQSEASQTPQDASEEGEGESSSVPSSSSTSEQEEQNQENEEGSEGETSEAESGQGPGSSDREEKDGDGGKRGDESDPSEEEGNDEEGTSEDHGNLSEDGGENKGSNTDQQQDGTPDEKEGASTQCASDSEEGEGDQDSSAPTESGGESKSKGSKDAREFEGDEDPEDGAWEMSAKDFENAGGHVDLGRDFESNLQEAAEVLKGDDSDGVMTNQTAIDQALEEEMKKSLKDVESGERVWRPYNPMLDEAHIVTSTDISKDLEFANKMLVEVRSAVTYLRTRLRTIVKAQEMTSTTHGVRRGKKLSPRMLVDTAIDLRSGRMPKRAYQRRDPQIDTSIDMAICLDQSWSMGIIQYQVAQVMMILAESLESIGGSTFAFGFRDGEKTGPGGFPQNWRHTYHRVHGIRYDVFKTWEEKFATTKWRFAHTTAYGSTPMSDGIQLGLQALDGRSAAHRILAVITDGEPTKPHTAVIKRQLRIAKEAGVQVIGIGIGEEAKYVNPLFGSGNAVWAATVNEMPKELLTKLNQLCDFTGQYRGRRMKLDGKTGS